MNMLHTISAYLRRLPLLYSIAGVVCLVVVAVLGVHFLTRAAPALPVPPEVAHVRVASVASLSSQTGPLSLTGKVTSLSQANILAESSGEIVTLARALGDRVAAGQVIAEFDNSSEQAAVQQAQGAYDVATAALAKASGSTAVNSGITSTQAAQGAANAQASAIASLQSTYAVLDDAVHTKADVLFSNPRSQTPTFLLNVPDNQLSVNIVNERAQLEGVLSAANGLSGGTTASGTDSAVSEMILDAQTVSSFLNDVVKALSEAQPNQNNSAAAIASDQASVGAARTAVAATLSSLTSAKNAYDSAEGTAQTAANSAGSGTNNDIAAAEAQVKEALGALNSAKANLEKTIIRSPISGTIVSLPITQGDYVASFSQVAEVSNPNALEVDTYVTPDDAKTLAVGAKALINASTNGLVVSIAPALDPTTGKIQVKLGIVGDQSGLTDGDTVIVSLDRSVNASANAQAATKAFVIPIIAAKITPQGPVVFTVSSSTTLVSNPLTLGTVLGDQVTVVSGLTPEMNIVTDARGLSDGQTVVVDTQ